MKIVELFKEYNIPTEGLEDDEKGEDSKRTATATRKGNVLDCEVEGLGVGSFKVRVKDFLLFLSSLFESVGGGFGDLHARDFPFLSNRLGNGLAFGSGPGYACLPYLLCHVPVWFLLSPFPFPFFPYDVMERHLQFDVKDVISSTIFKIG